MDDFSKLYSPNALHMVDADMARFAQKYIEQLSKAFTNLFVIDIGCGTGLNANWIQRRYEKACSIQVLGVDINKEAIKHSIGNCIEYDMFKLGNNCCNVVTDIECLSYLGEKGLKKVVKMLSPSGVLFSKWFMEVPKGVNWAEQIYPWDKSLCEKYFQHVDIMYESSRIKAPDYSVREMCWIGFKKIAPNK